MSIKNYVLPLLLCSSLIANHTESKMESSSDHVTDPYYYTQEANEYFGYAEWIYWNPMTADPMNWGEVIHQAVTTNVVVADSLV